MPWNILISGTVLFGLLAVTYFRRGWNALGIGLSLMMAGVASLVVQAITHTGLFAGHSTQPITSAADKSLQPELINAKKQLHEFLKSPLFNESVICGLLDKHPALAKDLPLMKEVIERAADPSQRAERLFAFPLRQNPEVANLTFDWTGKKLSIRNGSLLHLDIAAFGPQAERLLAIVKQTPDKEALLHSTDEEKRTILHLAVLTDVGSIGSIYKIAPANAHARDERGMTPLHCLLERSQFTVGSVLWGLENARDLLGAEPSTALDRMPDGSLPSEWLRNKLRANQVDLNSPPSKELLEILQQSEAAVFLNIKESPQQAGGQRPSESPLIGATCPYVRAYESADKRLLGCLSAPPLHQSHQSTNRKSHTSQLA